jgi:general stress protein CsbA
MALFSLSQKSIQTIKSITNSTYLDFIGLVIVISASLALGYQKNSIQFFIS